MLKIKKTLITTVLALLLSFFSVLVNVNAQEINQERIVYVELSNCYHQEEETEEPGREETPETLESRQHLVWPVFVIMICMAVVGIAATLKVSKVK